MQSGRSMTPRAVLIALSTFATAMAMATGCPGPDAQLAPSSGAGGTTTTSGPGSGGGGGTGKCTPATKEKDCGADSECTQFTCDANVCNTIYSDTTVQCTEVTLSTST
jgi:hypothetical protein